MARRNGYTDFAIPIKLLRNGLAKAIRGECAQMSHAEIVQYGVNKILNAGLFEKYADEFKGYIVANALNMAETDVRAAGIDPVRGMRIPVATPKSKPISVEQVKAEKEQADKDASSRLADLSPILFMRLPTPFRHKDGSHKTLGELTGKEGRKLTGGLAKFFKGVPDGKRLIDVKSEAGLRELWAKL